MSKGKWFLGVAVLALAGAAVLSYSSTWTAADSAKPASPRGSAANRVVPVEIARAERSKVPVKLDALGMVTPIASVAVKPRLETTIIGVHFRDGASVNKGDLLFTLDCRQTDAQIATTEGQLARDKAQLEGAERDVTRYTDLVAKSATPVVNLDNAKTQANVNRAVIKATEGVLENLKVQRTYCSITAPIAGRISAAAVKVGNFVRQADAAPMATINQMAPVYVSFTVPQKRLPDIRQAIAAETATVEAIIPGSGERATGQVTMIENTIDSTTGMATIRASMPNKDELLWPGTLVTAEMTLRVEDAIVVPSDAVQMSQTGHFVFIVDKGAARVQSVKIERQVGSQMVIASGLQGGETVVTDGQVQLSNGTRVNPRPPKAAAGS